MPVVIRVLVGVTVSVAICFDVIELVLVSAIGTLTVRVHLAFVAVKTLHIPLSHLSDPFGLIRRHYTLATRLSSISFVYVLGQEQGVNERSHRACASDAGKGALMSRVRDGNATR